MPAYVARRIQDALNRAGRPVNGSSILLVGVSYKANISDQRETPARPLAQQLSSMGAEIFFLDPHVDSFMVQAQEVSRVDMADADLSSFELVVVLQPHKAVLEDGVLDSARRILDTSGTLSGDRVERL